MGNAPQAGSGRMTRSFLNIGKGQEVSEDGTASGKVQRWGNIGTWCRGHYFLSLVVT